VLDKNKVFMDNSAKEPIVKKDGRTRVKKQPVGRPKELGTKVQELKNKLLNSADSSRIVNKVIEKALNDDDKDQMIALKLCLDRILPVSLFERAKDHRNAIQINIMGLDSPTIDSKTIEVEDVEFTESKNDE
jgi:hypothetical protein